MGREPYKTAHVYDSWQPLEEGSGPREETASPVGGDRGVSEDPLNLALGLLQQFQLWLPTAVVGRGMYS